MRTNLRFVTIFALVASYGSARAVQVLDQQWTTPAPLTQVNSDSAEEWSPFLSFDGLTLYFARVRSEAFYYGRIFQATRQQPFGPFTEVREVDGPLNSSGGHNLLPWVSPDNLRMYYHNESGGRFALMLSERTSAAEPWPQGTSILELNRLGGQIQAPKLTPDELTIFFNAYEMPGGKGAYDLWMASRDDRNSPFGQVRNLSEINTVFSEGAPSISPDGLTLLFHSNRNGPMQLFNASRESFTEPFGNPEHLSFADVPGGHSMHPYLTGDGGTLYFIGQLDQDQTTRDIYVSYYIAARRDYYVDAVKGRDNNDGLSPSAAFATIQKGIDSAQNGDEVIVYPGVYLENINFKGRNITLTSTDPNNPAVVAATIIDGGQKGSVVTFSSSEGANCVLSGFTITNGQNNRFGGGILADGTSPTVRNCILTGNSAGSGGAICNYNESHMTLVECVISGNSAYYLAGGMHSLNSSPTLIDCRFSHNSASSGGGMCTADSNVTLINCIFGSNSARIAGGMYNAGGSQTMTGCIFEHNSGGAIFCEPGISLTITNCTITENSAESGGAISSAPNKIVISNSYIAKNSAKRGGAIYSESAPVRITNSVVSENTAAEQGGAIFLLGGLHAGVIANSCTFVDNAAPTGRTIACRATGGTVAMTNSILWNGGHEIWSDGNFTITVTYSDVQGGWPGEGNINADPRFAELAEGLAAHWKFDEQQGDIAYDSAGDNHGAIHGAQWTTGWLAGALSFDGLDDYVSVSGNAVTSTEFTVSAWANHRGLGGGRNNTNMIFSQRDDDATPASRSIIVLASERLRDSPYAFAGIQSSAGVLQELTHPKKDYNEWHHYAMTVNASDFILYIDGLEVNRSPNNQMGNYVTSVDYVDIGRHRYFKRDNGFFNGVIDEVAVWNRALSPEEIRRLYSARSYYELLPDSPCIDAGDPQYLPEPDETDFSGKARLVGKTIDMGAYEAQPAIELTVGWFEFDATIGFPNPVDQILIIRNSGAGTLNWQISYDCDWLKVEPNSGVSQGQGNTAWLRVNSTGLSEGQYHCQLTVSAPLALNSPQTVQVTFIVRKNCFPDGLEYAQQYTDFLNYAAGGADPSCWCASWSDGTHYQCYGDASGRKQTFTNYRVFTDDLALVIKNWKRKIDTADPCADIDHKAQLFQKYRVFTNDLAVLVANWKKRDDQLANNCPRPDGQ